MKRKKAKFHLALFLLLTFAGSFFTPVFAASPEAPVITADPLIITPGVPYDLREGVHITDDLDSEADLLARLEIYDYNLDPKTPGIYLVTYVVLDSQQNSGSFDRPVAVVADSLPVILAFDKGIDLGSVFDPLAQVYAYDKEDGFITSSLKVLADNVDTSAVGEYHVTYGVTDSDANYTELTIGVSVYWTEDYYPQLTAKNLMLKVGDPFDPLMNITATDKTDGDITDKVMLEYSEVNMDYPGIYSTSYYVDNSLMLRRFAQRYVVVFDVSTSSPVIMANDMKLETGYPFDPLLGAFAFDLEDGDLTSKITVKERNVDIDKAGEYFITYQVFDADGHEATLTIFVLVDWSYEKYPQIYAEDLYLPVNADFDPLLGVTATDPTDGDLTAKVEVAWSSVDMTQQGIYNVEYMVTNSLGITGYGSRRVLVFASSTPMILAENTTARLHEELTEKSFYVEAYDLEDGDLRDAVVMDASQVDIHTAGVYPVLLSVTDSDGNTAQIEIQVEMVDYSYPQLDVSDHTIYLDEPYEPLNYVHYAYDEMDGDLYDQVIVKETTVDIHTLGTYTTTYSLTNSQGKTTEVTANVEVVPKPVVEYFLLWEGKSFLLQMDESQQMLWFDVPELLSAGASVSIAIFVDGELVFEVPGFTLLHNFLPGERYLLIVNDKMEVSGSIVPVLRDGLAFHYTAKDGSVKFVSNTEGELYYRVVTEDTWDDPWDFSIPGLLIETGDQELALNTLSVGKTPLYVELILKDALGNFSEVLRVEIPREPNIPNNFGKNAPNNDKKNPEAPPVVETPAEPPVETPVETPMETPAEPPVETPAEPPVETPVETPPAQPAESPAP